MTAEENNSSSPALSANTELTTPSPSNEYLDDVFGSRPPTPLLNREVDLSPGSRGDLVDAAVALHRESLDVARLRSIHSKAGYRDGLAAAKEATLQPGFDEGYTLGAALGLHAGLIMGTLESLRDALDFGQNNESKVKFEKLVARCHSELQRQSLLSDQFIDMEGLWTWKPRADANIQDVAASHPLIKVWQARMKSALEMFGFSVEKLDARWVDEEAIENAPAKKTNMSNIDTSVPTRQVFDF